MSTPGEARAARPTDLPAIAAILDAVWLELETDEFDLSERAGATSPPTG